VLHLDSPPRRPARRRLLRPTRSHYWTIDPVKRSFEVYRLEADRYTLPLELTDDAVYEPEWLAGLRVPLRELWM
jgi:hypothetical protein